MVYENNMPEAVHTPAHSNTYKINSQALKEGAKIGAKIGGGFGTFGGLLMVGAQLISNYVNHASLLYNNAADLKMLVAAGVLALTGTLAGTGVGCMLSQETSLDQITEKLSQSRLKTVK